MTPRPDVRADAAPPAPGARRAGAATEVAEGDASPTEPPPRPAREPVQRWRLVVRRTPPPAGGSQNAWAAALGASLAAAGFPLAGLDASPPRARLVVAAALPAGIPGERELVDVLVTSREPAWRVREAVAAALPEGDALVECYDVWLGEPALPGRVTGSVYRITLDAEDAAGLASLLAGAAAAMLAASSLPRERQKGDARVRYELRPFLEDLRVEPAVDGAGVVVHAVLRHDPERGIGRPEEVLAELADRVGRPLAARALIRDRVLLADELPPLTPASGPATPARRGRRPGR